MAAEPSIAYDIDTAKAVIYNPVFPDQRIELTHEEISELKLTPGFDYYEEAQNILKTLYYEKYIN